jgi:hypothetical protein
MEPTIQAAAVEMPTLVAAGSEHCGIGGETLVAVVAGEDGEWLLAGIA